MRRRPFSPNDMHMFNLSHFFLTAHVQTSLQFDGNVKVVQQNTDRGERANVTNKDGHGAGVAHMPSLNVQVDSTSEHVGEQEKCQAVAVESVQHLARSVRGHALLDGFALGAVQGGEHKHLDGAEEQQLREIEGAHPAHVCAVGHSAGHEQVRSVVPQAPEREDEPDEGPFEEVDDGELGKGVEGLHGLLGLPVLGLFLFGCNDFLDLLLLLLLGADDGGEPVGVLVHGVSGSAGGGDGILGRLLVTWQDALTGAHAGHEDGEVADERVDALAVLGEEVTRDALGEDDVVLQRSNVKPDLVTDSNSESNGAVRWQPAKEGLEESESGRK